MNPSDDGETAFNSDRLREHNGGEGGGQDRGNDCFHGIVTRNSNFNRVVHQST